MAVERYSLASSVIRNQRRLVAVASGFKTKNDRSRESIKLLTWGFTNFDTIEIAKKNEPIVDLDVWLGKANTVQGYVDQNIYETIKKARKKDLKVVAEYNGPIEAPILKDEQIGVLKVYYKDELLDDYKIFSYSNVKKVNLLSRLFKSINYLVWGDV